MEEKNAFLSNADLQEKKLRQLEGIKTKSEVLEKTIRENQARIEQTNEKIVQTCEFIKQLESQY